MIIERSIHFKIAFIISKLDFTFLTIFEIFQKEISVIQRRVPL